MLQINCWKQEQTNICVMKLVNYSLTEKSLSFSNTYTEDPTDNNDKCYNRKVVMRNSLY